jgi:hypothetical protein
MILIKVKKKKIKSIPVTGCGGLEGGTNWTVSTATSSQYLAVDCEPIV